MKLKKIFNFLYKDILSQDKASRYRSIMNIVATRYTINSEGAVEKQYYLFNKMILSRTDKSGIRVWKGLFGYKKEESLWDVFKSKYHKYYKDYDDIYMFCINSGEIFLFLKYVLHNLIKKRNSRSPLILTNRKYHIDLMKLFYPDIPCVYIRKIKPPVERTEFKIDNHNFTLVVPKAHLDNVEKNITENPLGFSNYFHPLLELYGCTQDDIKSIKIKDSSSFEKSMLKKIKKIGLNLDNFIFIAPEAQSCLEISSDFWEELIRRYKNQGYDVFVNVTKKKSGFKNIFLTYGEAYALSKHAKRIVALRSGICELLSEADVAMDILYTDFRIKPFFKDIKCAQVMSAFGFHNLPCVSKKINEYAMTDDFEDIYKKLGV